jgi:high-affinity iron transporter
VGAGLGLLVCMVIGAGIIGTFYTVGQNKWANTAEYWEGALSIIASVIISLMGAALLRVSKLQDKWRAKLAQAFEAKPSNSTAKSRFKRWCEKYAMFVLPFITVLREGVEVVIFVSGVSYASPASAFPLPAVVGLACGCGVGVALFK